MTLVITTATAQGITVVGDRAVTRTSASGTEIIEATKVWYSSNANVALAFWGNADFPGNTSYEEWARDFVAQIQSCDTAATIAERLVSTLNPILESFERPWSCLRRGIHISGYESDLPVIFHVHTGDPRAFHHALEVHREYPDSPERYRQDLQGGYYLQLRNGHYEVFVTLAQAILDSQKELASVLGVPVPATTLHGQAAFDETLVRLAAGLLKSAQLPQSVSAKIDIIAFTSQGRVCL